MPQFPIDTVVDEDFTETALSKAAQMTKESLPAVTPPPRTPVHASTVVQIWQHWIVDDPKEEYLLVEAETLDGIRQRYRFGSAEWYTVDWDPAVVAKYLASARVKPGSPVTRITSWSELQYAEPVVSAERGNTNPLLTYLKAERRAVAPVPLATPRRLNREWSFRGQRSTLPAGPSVPASPPSSDVPRSGRNDRSNVRGRKEQPAIRPSQVTPQYSGQNSAPRFNRQLDAGVRFGIEQEKKKRWQKSPFNQRDRSTKQAHTTLKILHETLQSQLLSPYRSPPLARSNPVHLPPYTRVPHQPQRKFSHFRGRVD